MGISFGHSWADRGAAAANPLPPYAAAFGLSARPFAATPAEGAIFWSGAHLRAQSVLEYGVVSAATAVVLTGEPGTGKTTLIQDLIARLGGDVRVALLANGQPGPRPVAAWVLAALGQPPAPEADALALAGQLASVALGERAAGRRILVIVDEAQALDTTALEDLRLLTNPLEGTAPLAQLVLVGHGDLRDRLRGPWLRPLAQRVAAASHLGPMDAETVAAYVAHGLRAAGGTGEDVTPAAAQAIHAATGGIARLVNQLCDFALLYAWGLERGRVDEALVSLVLSEGVFFGCEAPPPVPPPASAAQAPALRRAAG